MLFKLKRIKLIEYGTSNHTLAHFFSFLTHTNLLFFASSYFFIASASVAAFHIEFSVIKQNTT